jgi:diguanylate cyclase (GGDEF)-like protein
VLLVETGKASAHEVAERLRQVIAAAEVPLEDGSCVHFTTSIGVATAEPEDSNIEALIKRADQALYQAKNTGRNRVV